MQIVNIHRMQEHEWVSPKGKFGSFYKLVSEELGRDPTSLDLSKRHPFDVEINRIPPGKILCPYHSHSAQWEFYLVLSGSGLARDPEGEHRVVAGDAFLFPPGVAHQIRNDGEADLVYLIVADNPIGEHCFYPDSGKWLVRLPERRLLAAQESVDYYQGEE